MLAPVRVCIRTVNTYSLAGNLTKSVVILGSGRVLASGHCDNSLAVDAVEGSLSRGSPVSRSYSSEAPAEPLTSSPAFSLALLTDQRRCTSLETASEADDCVESVPVDPETAT